MCTIYTSQCHYKSDLDKVSSNKPYKIFDVNTSPYVPNSGFHNKQLNLVSDNIYVEINCVISNGISKLI